MANKLRTDNIVQTASTDSTAPNMQDGTVKEGSIKFYYSMGEEKLDDLRQLLAWDFANSKETKELNLTHNLIAPKAGFKNLMAIYDADKILKYRNRIKDYIKEKNVTDDFSTLTFGQVVEKLLEGKATPAEQRPILPTPMMQKFIDENHELYEIARNYPFVSFSKIYVDKDALLDDKKADEDDESKEHSKRDSLIKHLFKIQTNVNLYTDDKYNDFLRKTEFKINSVADKKKLKEIVVHLRGMCGNTIEEVIEYAHDKKICRKDDKLTEFIEKKYVYDQVKQLRFQEFQNLFLYLEGYTPFSTQHKIKGAQFNNVLVVLDNGNWSNYNFEYLMDQEIVKTLTPARQTPFPTILDRTQKLFYVCCTRTKESLVVYFFNPSQAVLIKARGWFGAENVHEI